MVEVNPTEAAPYRAEMSISGAIQATMGAIDQLVGSIISIPAIFLKSAMLSVAWISPLVGVLDSILAPFGQFA
jgi:hypothetical protein